MFLSLYFRCALSLYFWAPRPTAGAASKPYLNIKAKTKESIMDEQLKQSALDFHQFPVPGKIPGFPTKLLATQRSGVGLFAGRRRALPRDRRRSAGGLQIHRARQPGGGDFNGTAVLGLGTSARWPVSRVMEGKAFCSRSFPADVCLISKWDEHNPDKLIDTSLRWNRPSAASTWKTSRRRSVSTSNRNCASA